MAKSPTARIGTTPPLSPGGTRSTTSGSSSTHRLRRAKKRAALSFARKSQRDSTAVIRAEVTARLDSIGAISRQHEKPVLFTEVGYRAAPNALIHPHEWPERTAKPRFDPRAQAMGYQMLLEAVRHRPWVKGLYWWKWFTDPDTTEEGPAGFSPRGKLAEAILRSAYGGNCAASSVR